MSEAPSTHGDDLQLLKLADGELPAGEARALRTHLAQCDECRSRLEQVQSAAAVYLEFHRHDLKTKLPAPPRAWEDLRPSLDDLDSSGLRARGRNPWTWLALAAALAIAAVVWNRIGSTPPVSAAELLHKAAAVASEHADVHRRIRIRARGRSIVRPATSREDGDTDVASLFIAARYSWEEPLSARSFEIWRDHLSEKQDHVANLGSAYEIRTTTHSSTLTEAVLVLEATDLRPLRGSMRFGDDLVELSEADDSTTTAVPPVPKIPPRAAPQIGVSDELHVLAALHRISADLGEPIEVTRSANQLLVTATGLPGDRQKQIRAAVQSIPGVEVQFPEPDSTLPSKEEKREIAAAAPSELADLLGEASANRALDSSEAILSRAHALRALAQRFPANGEAQFGPADRTLLAGMVQDHSKALEASLADLEAMLSVALPPSSPASAAPLANWQSRALRVFERAQKLDQLLSTALSGSGSLVELSAALRTLHAEVHAP